MITTVPTRTITEVVGKKFSISCFVSMNDDGTTSPEIYDANILDSDRIVNDISGKEGELLITSEYPDVAKIEEGDLILSPKVDRADDYSKENEDLIYVEQ